jgi:hypothetical protein
MNMGKWTWGEIKKVFEDAGIDDCSRVWYIDIDSESDRDLVIVNIDQKGAEITNYPNL